MKRAAVIELSFEERATLEEWSRSRTSAVRLTERARIILMAADGIRNKDIAEELDKSRPTVQLWRDRFLAIRVAGLEKDAPRPGRIARISSAPAETAFD